MSEPKITIKTVAPKIDMKKMKESKDWHHVEFCTPINESFVNNESNFFIKGVAINETTTRNGITYVSEELEKAAPTFRNKPLLVDHENSIFSTVGRTTENVTFERGTDGRGRIDFEAQVMDKRVQEMINDGRIQNVSIGAMLEDLKEDEEAGTITAIGLEGLEISLVAVPGDPGAGLANALQESLKLKTKLKEDKLMEETEVERPEEETETPETPEAEAPAEAPETAPEETPETEEGTAEEMKSLKKELAKYKAIESKTKFENAVKTEVAKQLKEQSDTPDETPEETPDETTGTVGGDEEKPETEESVVVERAESGRGFSIWRDYGKENAGKFKRLSR